MESEWIKTEDQLPEMWEELDTSDNMVDFDDGAEYMDSRTCMMAGIAGGYGYFGEGFATSGSNGCDRGLIIDTPKYWRYSHPLNN